MRRGDGKVEFRYEGDRNKHDTLECVYTFRDKEYRLSYKWISSLRQLYGLPVAVREEILEWAKMLHNPD